jgi:hypothetical protein
MTLHCGAWITRLQQHILAFSATSIRAKIWLALWNIFTFSSLVWYSSDNCTGSPCNQTHTYSCCTLLELCYWIEVKSMSGYTNWCWLKLKEWCRTDKCMFRIIILLIFSNYFLTLISSFICFQRFRCHCHPIVSVWICLLGCNCLNSLLLSQSFEGKFK